MKYTTPLKLLRLKRWYKHLLGPIQGELRYNSRVKRHDEKYYIFRFGLEEGSNRYREYIRKTATSKTLQGYIEKYGAERGPSLYKEKNAKLSVNLNTLLKNGHSIEEALQIKQKHAKKSAHTLENFNKRYGIKQGEIKYNQYQKRSRVSVRSVKELVERKNYSFEDARKIVRNVQIRNINTFIKKHGEERGTILYDNYVKNKTSKLDNSTFSNIQLTFSQSLKETINRPDFKYVGLPFSKSGYIKFSRNKYDLQWCIPDLIINDKFILEFDGDYYHSFSHIKIKDAQKEELLKQMGYIVIRVKEQEFRQNRTTILTNLKEIILNENNKNNEKI